MPPSPIFCSSVYCPSCRIFDTSARNPKMTFDVNADMATAATDHKAMSRRMTAPVRERSGAIASAIASAASTGTIAPAPIHHERHGVLGKATARESST